MTKPQAFTLVEMSFSMAVGSVLMALALGMVHRTMRAASTARSQERVERTASQLSRQFRYDIHQAQSVLLDNQGADTYTLRLQLQQQPPIVYRIEKNSVVREQPRTSEQTYRESYLFPADHTVRFAELAAPSRAVLTLQHDTRLVGEAWQTRLHVEAVVGQFLSPGPPGGSGP